MTQVLPAIIPINKEQLAEELALVSDFAKLVQVDISDGIFTSPKTWPYNGLDAEFFEDLKTEKVGWPEWEKTDIEVHLMVKNPELVVPDWIRTGVVSVVAHIEATENFQKVITLCRGANISVGVAIKPGTDIGLLEPVVAQVDFIQMMGSDLLGRHNVPLEDVAITQIQTLRGLYPESIIAIDIGVSEDTAKMLVDAGANKLISGGAILKAVNPKEVFEHLQSF